jgi:hypothetical protein
MPRVGMRERAIGKARRALVQNALGADNLRRIAKEKYGIDNIADLLDEETIEIARSRDYRNVPAVVKVKAIEDCRNILGSEKKQYPHLAPQRMTLDVTSRRVADALEVNGEMVPIEDLQAMLAAPDDQMQKVLANVVNIQESDE